MKLVYCICRRPGMSRAEFARYWSEVHGPIGARIPGLRRLVQSLAIEESGRPADFDGMAELWFDDLAALEAARRSPEWAAATSDESSFTEAGRSASFVSRERTVLPPPPGGGA
ncbi:MAG TPA: EthD domain-containing protein [Gemmatimonadales bacterium]|nr:EthD domain-containing protein [Gemmatimonadales bacterium]